MVFVLEANMIVNEKQILLLLSHADFLNLILAIDYLLLSYFFTLTSSPYLHLPPCRKLTSNLSKT